MKRKVRIIIPLLVLAVVCVVGVLSLCKDKTVTVYYTNDIHSYIDNHLKSENGLTYSMVAALKANTKNSLLVDAGDHIQGTAYGGMDNGATIIKLMNAAGYDVATLGNHEFDYGMAGCMATVDAAEFPYVSCNFRHEADGVKGKTVLDGYVIKKIGGVKLAFVGITTPETISSSTPAYFQDEHGNYIYGIDGGEDGSDLYASVQRAIDSAKADGADYVIALGHLGVDLSSGPWTSRNVIANTQGLDAFIDGHSHTTIPTEQVSDKTGKIVLLTQTGSYLNAVGKLVISDDGEITTQLLTGEDIPPVDSVKKIEDDWISSINDRLGQVIGSAEVTLDNFDSDGKRLVRKQGTNSGDFAADALYYLFDDMGMDVDIAVMNGGGIRNTAITGQLTYLSCKEIHTFGNVACLLKVTGQQILDALEWGSKGVSDLAEDGSLLHVAGVTYTLDLRYESTVQADDKDVWTGGPTGEYRVKDVMIYNKQTGEYEPLDLTAEYNMAGYNYTLRDLGGGFAMLNGATNVLDYVMEDYMVLANYIMGFENGVVGAENSPLAAKYEGMLMDYSSVNGSGRINVVD